MSGLEILMVVAASYGSIFVGVPFMIFCLRSMGYTFQLVIEKEIDINDFGGGDDDDGDWQDDYFPMDDGGLTADYDSPRINYLNNPEYYDWMSQN